MPYYELEIEVISMVDCNMLCKKYTLVIFGNTFLSLSDLSKEIEARMEGALATSEIIPANCYFLFGVDTYRCSQLK